MQPLLGTSLTIADHVATLSIARPSVLNAIDQTVIHELHLSLAQLQRPDSGVRAIVLTGSADVFCSGVDLHSVNLEHPTTKQRTYLDLRHFMNPLILALSDCRLPVVAAVNGVAAGAGMSLALACDIIVADENACFYASFARLGIVPDAGITFHLARRIGAGRSLAALMLSDKIDAKKALDWGLINAITPAGQALDHGRQIACRLTEGPKAVLSQIRSLHKATFKNQLYDQLRAEHQAQEQHAESREYIEGVRAFFEKRDPRFAGQPSSGST